MGQLTIITMNCLGLPVPIPGLRHRLQTLGRTLAASGTDVACLQEVGRWRHVPLLRHSETTWQHVLALDYPYAPKGGLIMLTHLPVLDMDYIPFQERGGMVSLHAPERLQGKGVLRAVLDAGDRQVVLLNTHLAANYSARWSFTNPYARVERAQLRELAAVVQAVPADTLVVVAGDLNVPRRSWLYHEFLQSTGLYDPLSESREPTYRPLAGLPARAAQALDHVLVRPTPDRAIIAHAELCFGEPVYLDHGQLGYLSDHLGVRMTLTWSTARMLDKRSSSMDLRVTPSMPDLHDAGIDDGG